MYKFSLLISLFFCFGLQAVPVHIQQAVEHPQRPAPDKLLDKNRQPQQILTFFGLEPGMHVLDLFSGGGYYSELAAYTVGENGKVDAHNNQAYIDYIGAHKLQQRYQGRLPNIRQVITEASEINFAAQSYDRILMILTFHDLYFVDVSQGWSEIDDDKLMHNLYQALKPDGIIGIVDHSALPNTSEETGHTLHRISAALVKQKMQQWGFTFIAESNVLHNPKDPLTIPMWAPAIKGKTHRFVMKFRR